MRQKILNLSLAIQHRKITTALVIANICVLTLYVSGWTFGMRKKLPPQDNKKIVEKHWAPKNEPVEIIDTKAKLKAVKLGESFEDESDWLKHVTFKIRNRSDKAIIYLQIDLDFPETKATVGSIATRSLFFGRRSDDKFTLNNPPLYIKPNETMEVSVAAEYDQIKRLIELTQPTIGNINKLTITTNEAIFEDGTLYSGGAIFKPNPDSSSPRKWILTTDAFGNKH